MEQLCRFRPPAVGRQITWEITRFCNLFCDHCCTLSGPDAPRSQEPPLSALIAAAADLGHAGVTKVQFSGGEPLLRQGFLDVLDSVDTDVVKVHLASNGYPLTDRVIDRLLRAGLHKLSVSLDGGGPAEHDLLRRRPGAFVRTVNGICRAAEAGLRVGVSVTVTPGNIASLEVLVQRLVDVQVVDISFHSVIPVGRAAVHPELIFPSVADTLVEDEVYRLHEKYGAALTFDHSFGESGSRGVRGCPALDRLLHIDPSGAVSPCSWLHKLDPDNFTLGNITTDSLLDIVVRHCARLDVLRAADPEHCVIPLVPLAVAR